MKAIYRSLSDGDLETFRVPQTEEDLEMSCWSLIS